MQADTESALVLSCKQAATALSVYCEWISQRGGRRSGTFRGAPDCLLYVGGTCIPIEMKRARNLDGTPAGVLSRDQTVAIERRLAQGVETYVVSDVQQFASIVNEARRSARRQR
jgi:hypothetical protein